MKAPFLGKAALVTGSSSGIGRAIAIAMHEAGAAVIFHGHQTRPADLAPEAVYLESDLSRKEGPLDTIEAGFRARPDLNILVSNAGGFFDAPFSEMTDERWETTIRLNLRSSYFLVQAFARRLIQANRSGAVVIVSSANAFQSEMDSSAYDTAKGGLVTMTRTLALALGDANIRVNAIAPGLIRTPLTEDWIASRHALRSHYEKNIPLKRIGLPEDCAGAVVFLASEAASYITGQTLIIDGGLTVRQIGPI